MPVEDILELREKTIKTKKNPYVKQKEHFAEQNKKHEQNEARQKYEEQKKEKDKKEISGGFNKLNSVFKNINGMLEIVSMKEKAIVAGAALAVTGILALVGYLSKGEFGSFGGDGEGSPYSYDGVHFSDSEPNAAIKNKIIDEAKAQGVDPDFALAIAEQESHFNPKATSETGARGIFQMTTPACKQLGIPFDDKLYDADYNIKHGIAYLKWCLKQTNGNLEEAAAAFNSGIGTVQKAKKNGQDVGTLLNTQTVSKEKGYSTNVMQKMQNWKDKREKIARDYSSRNATKTEGNAKISDFVNIASKKSARKSSGKCAARVHDYLEAAGIILPRMGSAYEYAKVLQDHPNFIEIDPQYAKRGDVIVNGPKGEHIHGHIFIFDGRLFTKHPVTGQKWPNSGWSDFTDTTGQINPAEYGWVKAFRYLEKKPQSQPDPKPVIDGQNKNVDKSKQNNENLKNKTEPPKQQPKPQPKPTPQPTKVQQPANSQQKQPQRIDIGKANPYNANAKQKQNATNKKK